MTHGNYYHMSVKGDEAELTIYGDISEYDRWDERATGAYTLAKKLEALGNVRKISVNINSLGGDVKEGIAIYNALQRHPAKVTTRCDGWACSIASVIFMAGDVRIMYPTSLLMIHNAWTCAWGANASEMRKLADDLDTITGSSKAAYLEHVSLTEEELTEKMDAETWITPEEAVEWGFATKLEKLFEPPKGAIHQSVRGRLFDMITAPHLAVDDPDPDDEDEEEPLEDDGAVEEPVDDPETEEPADDEDGGEEDPEPEPEEEDGEEEKANEAAMAAFFMALDKYLGGK